MGDIPLPLWITDGRLGGFDPLLASHVMTTQPPFLNPSNTAFIIFIHLCLNIEYHPKSSDLFSHIPHKKDYFLNGAGCPRQVIITFTISCPRGPCRICHLSYIAFAMFRTEVGFGHVWRGVMGSGLWPWENNGDSLGGIQRTSKFGK